MGSKIKNQLETDAYSRDEKEQIRSAIRQKYAKVSSTADDLFRYPTGRDGALKHGYEKAILDDIPEDMLVSFCGVGNPFSLGEIQAGSSVLDIGCGSGVDLVVARKKVGENGKACGVDLTGEMVAKAQASFKRLDLSGVEAVHISSEKLPFGDQSFDLVISNGVINLSPEKPELFAEIYRVLRPGGRLQIADVVLAGELPLHMAGSLEAWSQ